MSPPYSKRDVFRFLLDQGQSVRILLDARREGVIVPARFRGVPQLILEVGLNMNPPIPDLDIEGDGVRCTLSFAKQPFHCTLPWSSIWALIGKRDGRGYQWVEDIPPELVAVPQAPPPPRMPPVLRAVPAQSPSESSAPSSADSNPTAPSPPSPSPTKVVSVGSEPAQETLVASEESSKEKSSSPEPSKTGEEVVEELAPGKKKRQLPSYLRVIK
ncbi:MAG: ClpXP protease specificity-enhancing factor SspB [Myxococcales bacterium]|nr:ClpXP protease specificity-enhancing factor SspB [Polyangiaceae bacterium]MDW8251521.1 ClpXP protease specificity-enhancing factor SspB [Myxococcales bacterium]